MDIVLTQIVIPILVGTAQIILGGLFVQWNESRKRRVVAGSAKSDVGERVPPGKGAEGVESTGTVVFQVRQAAHPTYGNELRIRSQRGGRDG